MKGPESPCGGWLTLLALRLLAASLTTACLLAAPVGLAQASPGSAPSSGEANPLDAPLHGELQHRLRQQPLNEVYDWLVDQVPTPPERLEVERWLGQMALAMGRDTQAAAHFERVVVQQPLDFGTRLDLTLAYLRSGNRQAANASLAALEHHLRQQGWDPAQPHQGGLPAGAATQLARLRRALDDSRGQATDSWVAAMEGSLSLGQGYDSNANLGARDSRIPLNLWGEVPVVTELAPASLAQGSHYTELELDLTRPVLTERGGEKGRSWQWLAGAQARHYHQLDALHRRDAYLGLSWRPTMGGEQWLLAVQRQEASGFAGRTSLLADYRRQVGSSWMLNANLLWQEEPRLPASHTLGLGLWRQWQGGLLWVSGSWQQRPERSAGDTWRTELGAESPAWRLGRLVVTGHARLQRRGDTAPYSPPFFGDLRRDETTLALGATASLPLSAQWQLFFEADWEQTDADIALFENRRWQLQSGLKWRW